MERSDQIARIKQFAQRHSRGVLFDEATATVFDVYSGKTLTLDLSRFGAVHEKVNPEGGSAYLVLPREDGVEVALADPGIAFALDIRNSGPIPNAPSAVCMRDFTEMLGRIRHYLFDHPDVPVSRDVLAHIQFGIALLDGARRIGLEIGEEERALEECLVEVERRAGTPDRKS